MFDNLNSISVSYRYSIMSSLSSRMISIRENSSSPLRYLGALFQWMGNLSEWNQRLVGISNMIPVHAEFTFRLGSLPTAALRVQRSHRASVRQPSMKWLGSDTTYDGMFEMDSSRDLRSSCRCWWGRRGCGRTGRWAWNSATGSTWASTRTSWGRRRLHRASKPFGPHRNKGTTKPNAMKHNRRCRC